MEYFPRFWIRLSLEPTITKSDRETLAAERESDLRFWGKAKVDIAKNSSIAS